MYSFPSAVKITSSKFDRMSFDIISMQLLSESLEEKKKEIMIFSLDEMTYVVFQNNHDIELIVGRLTFVM